MASLGLAIIWLVLDVHCTPNLRRDPCIPQSEIERVLVLRKISYLVVVVLDKRLKIGCHGDGGSHSVAV